MPETYVTIGNMDKANCVVGKSDIPRFVYRTTGYALTQTYTTCDNTKGMHPLFAPSKKSINNKNINVNSLYWLTNKIDKEIPQK